MEAQIAAPPELGDRGGHLVELFESETELAETVSGFAAPALLGGDAAMIVASPRHRRVIGDALRGAGVDLEGAIVEGRYREFDAFDLLAAFMVNGSPDPDHFRASARRLVERALEDGRRLRLYGEMVSMLWENGDLEATIALEGLWNELLEELDFSVLCGYPAGSFEGEPAALRQICDCHDPVTPA